MLRQHFTRQECPIGSELTLSHDALPFLEKVREDPFERHGHSFRHIGHDKMHGQSIAFAGEAAVFDHSADAEAAPLRHVSIGCLRRRIKKHEIALERIQD